MRRVASTERHGLTRARPGGYPQWFVCIRLAVAALAAVFLVVACGKPEPPPPPKAATVAAPAVNERDEAARDGGLRLRLPSGADGRDQAGTDGKSAGQHLQHPRPSPMPREPTWRNPNPDVLDSEAWLDLAHEPVVLSVPDTHGRYYVMAMIDAWTNVFQSPGKRTTGTNKADFAIVGPKWKGELPQGCRGDQVADRHGLGARPHRDQRQGRRRRGAKLADQYKLAPLSQWRKCGAGRHAAGRRARRRRQDPAGRAGGEDGRADILHPLCRPVARQSAGQGRCADGREVKKLGIVAGQPFDMGKLDAAAAKGIEDGAKAALDAIVLAAKGSIGDLRNGWTIHWDLGRYGTNYGLRAVTAWLGLGANAPEDAIFASTHLDAGGHPLNGANKYVLHFDKGKAPPADGFWSLAMYNDKQLPSCANPIDRHAIGDRDKLRFNPDGSLDLYLQSEEPGQGQGIELAAGAEGKLQRDPARLLAEAGDARPELDPAADQARRLAWVAAIQPSRSAAFLPRPLRSGSGGGRTAFRAACRSSTGLR